VPQPTYSILISSRDEGIALRRTLDSLFHHSPAEPFEIIVVDDASADGSTRFLEDGEYRDRPIRLERNDVCRGLIYSRARAADLGRGRYLCVLDAHCCASERWLDRLAHRLGDVAGKGLVVPSIRPLDAESWSIDGRSAHMTACTVTTPFLDFGWCDPRFIEGLPCTGTMPGGAWMCTREWYHEVGGLDRGMVGWGAENIDLALRTWVLGGWCLVAGDVEVGHLFKTESDDERSTSAERPMAKASSGGPSGAPHPAAALAFNKIRAAHNVFTRDTLQKVIRNIRHVPGFKDALDLIRGDAKSLIRMKDHVESRRKRSDRWLIETFDLPVLESPSFHCRRTWPHRELPVRYRPLVSVVISSSQRPNLWHQLASILDLTAYGRYDVLVFSASSEGDTSGLRNDGRHETSRLRFVETSAPLGGGLAHNCAVELTDAEYVVFLGEDARVLEEHWLEEFILLFERRPRLMMASPKLATVGATSAEADAAFDVLWDWDAPTFSRERRTPIAVRPYQALSCPDTCFMVHRERFLELGGFDRTIRRGAPPLMDLAVGAWLSGYEVFCHPGIVVGRSRGEDALLGRDLDPATESFHDYGRALIAEKHFTDPARIGSARTRNPAARALLAKHRGYLQRRREILQKQARYDDDWLFYKFGIEDLPDDV
jgi:GT2 family glycosyltransferase